MSIGPAIPGIRLFKNLTLKIRGQGHSSMSQSGSKSYRLRSLSFHVNRPSHSWDTTPSKFDLENSRSRTWVRSKFKVTMRIQRPIDWHPFRSMSIGPAIPGIQLLQNLTLQFQGQGHGWAQRSKPQCGSNFLSTHILFVPCQSALPFLGYSFFKIWPWNSEVKVIGQCHIVGPKSYRLRSLSFHVNRPSHSWDTTPSKFHLENPRSRSWVRSKSKATKRARLSIDSHTFRSMSIGPPIPVMQLFKNLTLKIQSQGHMSLMLHNYRPGQFHRTSNGVNPSSGFRDMCSTSLDPSAAWFDKFLARGQAHMGQMGKWLWRCTTTGLHNSIEVKME